MESPGVGGKGDGDGIRIKNNRASFKIFSPIKNDLDLNDRIKY